MIYTLKNFKTYPKIWWALLDCSSRNLIKLNLLNSFFPCALSVFDRPDQLQPLLNLRTFRFRSWVPSNTVLDNFQSTLFNTFINNFGLPMVWKIENMLVQNHRMPSIFARFSVCHLYKVYDKKLLPHSTYEFSGIWSLSFFNSSDIRSVIYGKKSQT